MLEKSGNFNFVGPEKWEPWYWITSRTDSPSKFEYRRCSIDLWRRGVGMLSECLEFWSRYSFVWIKHNSKGSSWRQHVEESIPESYVRHIHKCTQNEVWGKVIFSVACVKNTVHRRGSASVRAWIPPSPEQTPPRSRHPRGTRHHLLCSACWEIR